LLTQRQKKKTLFALRCAVSYDLGVDAVVGVAGAAAVKLTNRS
jgi:hypothetical protein